MTPTLEVICKDQGAAMLLRNTILKLRRFRKRTAHQIRFYFRYIHILLDLRKGTPVFVYQMGKVGSLSVKNSLKRCTKFPVIHVHRMSPWSLKNTQRKYGKYPLLTSDHHHKILREYITINKKKINLITLVREPIARNVSAFFMYLKWFTGKSKQISQLSIKELYEIFLSKYDHTEALNWFDDEIKTVLGIDVYQYPFPKEKGCLIIEKDHLRLLVIKSELEDAIKEKCLSEFLGLSRFKMRRDNVGQKKTYGNLYQSFIRTSYLPYQYLETMCHSKFTRHFYTEAEIEQVWSRWLSVCQKGQAPCPKGA